jgi:hypothetical protein
MVRHPTQTATVIRSLTPPIVGAYVVSNLTTLKSVQIYSIAASFPAPGGHRIIRPRDRSCWLLTHPEKRYRYLCWTRQDASDLAQRITDRGPAPDART